MSVWDGTVDLTGAKADEVGFPAIPSGSYEAHVAKAEWRLTDNLDGTKALPHETRYLAVGVQVNDDEPERDGQRVAGVYAGWTNLYIVPEGYDASKGQMMKNRFANFLGAIGEDWQKKGYKIPDVESLIGRPVMVTVRKKRDDNAATGFRNEIEGFKVAGSSVSSDAGLLV